MYQFKVLCLLAVLLVCSRCDYFRLRSINSDLHEMRCEKARTKVLNALKDKTKTEFYDYNLIHVFVCEDKIDKALKQADYVINQDTKFKYQAYFLKAYILGQMGEIEEALKSYQEALNVKPTKEIKQNMELLLKQKGRSGKGGKKKKKGKDGKTSKDAQGKSGDESDEKDKKNKKNGRQNKEPIDESEQQKKSQQKKSLSKKQIQQIMKEIDAEEKKVRSQGIELKKSRRGQRSDKNW